MRRPAILASGCKDAWLHAQWHLCQPLHLTCAFVVFSREFLSHVLDSRTFLCGKRGETVNGSNMAGKCSTLKERFIAFQATTRLDVLVPDVPECELPDQLEEALSTDLSHLPQRQNLFFGSFPSYLIPQPSTYLDSRRTSCTHPRLANLSGRRCIETATPQSSNSALRARHRRRPAGFWKCCIGFGQA